MSDATPEKTRMGTPESRLLAINSLNDVFKKEMRNGVVKTSIGILLMAASIKGFAVANEMGQNFDKAHDAVKDKIYNVILSGLIRKDPGMTAAANQITGNTAGTQTIWDTVNNATIVARNTLDQVIANLHKGTDYSTMTDFSSNPAYQYIWSKAHDLIVQYASMDNSGTLNAAMGSVTCVAGGIAMFAWAKSSHNFGKAMDALRRARKML